ncbi:unnamed protein product [Auanema sp. JU1783]|nr:unnamed protein product [Auanema sp. JU1783]
MKAFRRLTVQCPLSSVDFLTGILRRSRLSLARMTTDIEYLALMKKVSIAKESYRKYFSNCEDLWLLIVSCSDETLKNYLEVEDSLFTELHTITIQVHINKRDYTNVSKVIASFYDRYPKAVIDLELHSPTSKLIYEQIRHLPPIPLNKIKIICTEFDLPQLRLDELYNALKETSVMPKNVSIRDWSLYSDGNSPVSHLPLDTYRISCCRIETVDNLVKSLHMTSEQERPKVKKKVVKRKKQPVESPSEEEEKPKKKLVKKIKKKKPLPYIKKFEIAGQCTLSGLQFLEKKAHMELEKRLVLTIPEMIVDCSEIYYCF